MLSRGFLRVSRPANSYVCLSCLARQHARSEQTRLQSSTALHPNDSPSDPSFAFNGTKSVENPARPSTPEHPTTKIKGKKPKQKAKETPQETPSHGDKAKVGPAQSRPKTEEPKATTVEEPMKTKGKTNEPAKPSISSKNLRSAGRKKNATQLKPSKSTREKNMGEKEAQKSTVSEGSTSEISAQKAQQGKLTEPKKGVKKPAISPKESRTAKKTESPSQSQSTLPYIAAPKQAQKEQTAHKSSKPNNSHNQASYSMQPTAASPVLKIEKSEFSPAPRISFIKSDSPPPPILPRRRRYLASASASPDVIKRLASPLRRAGLRKSRIRGSTKERTPHHGQPRIGHTQHAPSTTFFWAEGPLSLKEALTGRRGVRNKAVGNIERLSPEDLQFQPLDVKIPPVPMLSHGLDRVLFNPGIYHLQDPRSRVYNFDPYLEKIMPATEFDFDALSKYMTSSKDKGLINMAKEIGAKYTGSTSSMSGTLTHFHYLLSQWRPLNLKMLSKEFPEISNNFSKIQRAPTAIFLRWKDGTYAIDADKEFDSPNIMSWLGQSMEKLLTNPADEFERYRKSNPEEAPREDDAGPKSFHYSKQGNVLMRSQLDAYDPRLPGTGVFDLKTRAVVSIRMDSAEYEQRSGYQIRYTHGEWESFEREYFDMARATMLKYSLQVRMGRMDGIFVAYHNVERIFGFQYISLPDMDLTLHGQRDTCLGDQEFKLSVELLNEVLERATKKFPEQSIRLHFETRETKIPFMYIFAEPVTEEQVEEIQNKSAEQMLEFERSVGLGSSNVTQEKTRQEWQKIKAQVEAEIEQDQVTDDVAEVQDDELLSNSTSAPKQVPAECDLTTEDFMDKNKPAVGDDLPTEVVSEQESLTKQDPSWGINIGKEETAMWVAAEEVAGGKNPTQKMLIGDTKISGKGQQTDPRAEVETSMVGREAEYNLLDPTPGAILDTDNAANVIEPPTERTSILGFTLTIRNRVNGQYVLRPENLTPDDTWSIEYSLDEITQKNDRGLLLYSQTKRRRASQLDFEKKEEDLAFDHYRKLLAKYSEKGRDWRRKQDEIDASMGVKVYRPLGDDAYEVIRNHGPWPMRERVESVEDYLTWLYRNTRTNVQPAKPQVAENKEEAAVDDVDDYLGWLYGKGAHKGQFDQVRGSV